MKYLVMECHPGYAVLLGEDGRFVKAANRSYLVGQTVENPVLMRQAIGGSSRIIRWISGTAVAAAACLLIFFGITYYQNYIAPYSSIFLSINPQVQIDLNRQGIVVGLSGVNEDGKTLLDGYDGEGKDKITVADELIQRAIDMGFLSAGGQVSFSIDTPDQALYTEYDQELRTKVSKTTSEGVTIVIEINGSITQDPASSQSSAAPPASSAAPSSSAPASSVPSAPTHGTTDYSDTDYGPYADGVTDYDRKDEDRKDDGSDYSGTNYDRED